MSKNKYEPILVPVYINLVAEVIVYRDTNNCCFVYERISDHSQKRGIVKRNENETN